jgi:glyoxylase-like metal-dependent hydrolase (beta-lactamase superfamily II)
VPIFLHPEDRVLYDAADRQAALYGLPFDRPPAPDHDLADGDSIPVGAQVFSVMHVPGHAPGHVIFVGDNLIIGGDLIFMDSIGRTDLPGSDPVAMSQSLPPHLAVHPGHGPSTTLARELHHNPFLSGRARVPGG